MSKPGASDEAELSQADLQQLVKNGHRLVLLYNAHSPQVLPPVFERRDWTPFALTCLARCHYALETILRLVDRPADAAVIARTLYEHVVTLAWIAVEPRKHFGMLMREEVTERRKLYADLIRWGSELPNRDAIEKQLDEMETWAEPGRLPAVPDRALQADNYWRHKVPEMAWDFRRVYANLFRHYSVYVHPTIAGTWPFLSPTPTGAEMARPLANDGVRVAGMSSTLFAEALTVASTCFGWPPMDAVIHAFATGLDHHGED